jgi:hypothetical protein
MKKIIFREDKKTICIDEVDKNEPIFAKQDNKLVGMVVKEDKGWILRIGGELGAFGHVSSLNKLIKKGEISWNYEFFVV